LEQPDRERFQGCELRGAEFEFETVLGGLDEVVGLV